MNSSPLPEIPALGYLTEVSQEHRAFLTGFGKFIRTTDGQLLIRQGASQDVLYLVLSGTLHITADADGRKVLLTALAAGDSIGEINLFDPGTASADVTSRGDCLIWGISRSELDALFEADPMAGISMMKGLLRQTSAKVRKMNEKLLTIEKNLIHHFWS